MARETHRPTGPKGRNEYRLAVTAAMASAATGVSATTTRRTTAAARSPRRAETATSGTGAWTTEAATRRRASGSGVTLSCSLVKTGPVVHDRRRDPYRLRSVRTRAALESLSARNAGSALGSREALAVSAALRVGAT